MKPKCGSPLLIKSTPISTNHFQQRVSSDDIGLDKGSGAINGTVDVAFRGKMHYCIRLVLGEDTFKRGTVADIHLFKSVTVVTGYGFQGVQITCISELVHIDDAMRRFADDMSDHRGTDEPGAACYQYFHAIRRCCSNSRTVLVVALFAVRGPLLQEG